MRILCLTFISYLLLLSWQPCQDLAAKADVCPSTEARQFHLRETSPPEKGDECSPFCACSCCQISTAFARLNFSVKSRFTILTEELDKVFYQNNYFQKHLNSIWQPPKFNFTA